MNEAAKSLAQLKKANKLVRLAFHKNGPKSYKRGQGALLRALLENDGATQRELVKTLGINRSNLKDVVKKAQRNEYVTIESVDEPRTYAVKLTDLGRELAEKRVAANDRTADEILSCLTAEEVKQLDAITEKLIVAMKEKGISGKKKATRFAARSIVAKGCGISTIPTSNRYLSQQAALHWMHHRCMRERGFPCSRKKGCTNGRPCC